MKARFDEYGTKNGIAVTCDIVANEVIWQKLAAAVEAKQPPDVCFTTQPKAIDFASKGLLVDVTDVIAKIEKDQGKMFDAMKSWSLYQGKYYVVPHTMPCFLMWYRKDLLAKAGFNAPPQTWEELRVMAKKVTSAKDNIWGVGCGYGPTCTDNYNMMLSVLWSYGGGIMKDDTVIADAPESIAGFRVIANLFAESDSPDAVSGDDMYNNTAYLSGSAAFIFNQATIANSLRQQAPDIWASTGVALFPGGPKGRFSQAQGEGYMIIRNPGNEQEAKKLAAYVLDRTWYDPWVKSFSPVKCPAFVDGLDAFIKADPVMETVIASIKAGSSLQLSQRVHEPPAGPGHEREVPQRRSDDDHHEKGQRGGGGKGVRGRPAGARQRDQEREAVMTT